MPTSPPTHPPHRFKGMLNTLSRLVVLIVGAVLVAVLALAYPLLSNHGPAPYDDIEDHFKYASIGGESTNGIPYWVWKVLPVMFADRLPGEGYTSLGFIQEPGHDLPIGFARGVYQGIDVVTQNCATCHVGSLRQSPNDPPQIIPAMPSNTVDLGQYIQFITAVPFDPRFTAREMMPQIQALGAHFNPLQELIYRLIVIPRSREALLTLADKLAFIDRESAYGPGRVDTFTPYKTRQFGFPVEQLRDEELNGIGDFPSVWQQRPRQGMQLHWDGNNTSVDERNNSAALALVSPTNIDFDAIHRIRDWLWDLPAPAYPFAVDPALAAQGKPLFEAHCASCHAFDGKDIGQVVPLELIGTDRRRLDSYTPELAANQYTLFSGIAYRGKDQRFRHFRKTNGYSNHPLDGLWLRSPYLHNGSVPTLEDLLQPPDQRPRVFYRGNDRFDPQRVGFVSDQPEAEGKAYFKFDTSLPGNGNGGHTYGVELSERDRAALVEYLKTL
jgi:mono/diheme cytochrome c family protein